MSNIEENIQNYLSNCPNFTEKEFNEACELYGKKNVLLYINKLYRTTDNVDEFLNKYHTFLEEHESKDDDIESIEKSISQEIETSSFLKYYINIIKYKKVLTPEEEQNLFKRLNFLRENTKFLNIIDLLELHIDFASIFISIKDEKQIKSLIKLYQAKYISDDQNDYEYIINDENKRQMIKQYLKLYEEYSRPLTKEEIISHFPKIDFKYQKTISKSKYDEEIDNLIEILYIIRRLEYSNLKLVFSKAKLRKDQMPIEDIIQEGNIGLRKAILKFDSTKGCKFSTYATWWIKQATNRAIASQKDGVRKPFHIEELLRTYRIRYVAEMMKLGRTPTTEEMAEVLDISKEKCRETEKLVPEALSLDMTYGEEEDCTLLDMYPSEMFGQYESLEKIINRKALKASIEEVLETLTPKEAEVIRKRFGLGETKALTLEEIGKQYDVTRERIRQIEAKAIRKMRNPIRSKKIVDYYND